MLLHQYTEYQVATGNKKQDKLLKSGPLRQLPTLYLNLYMYNFIIREPIYVKTTLHLLKGHTVRL